MSGASNDVAWQAMPLAGERASRDLLAAHAPGLLVAARSIVLDEAEAQDVVQTTFEIALRKLDTLRDPAALRPWLYAILTREAFRSSRRLRRLLRLDTVVVDDLEATRADDVDRHAERVAVQAALRSLPRRMRAAVVLRHMAGLSVVESAQAMHVSENTVKTLLRLGMQRLREELSDD